MKKIKLNYSTKEHQNKYDQLIKNDDELSIKYEELSKKYEEEENNYQNKKKYGR